MGRQRFADAVLRVGRQHDAEHTAASRLRAQSQLVAHERRQLGDDGQPQAQAVFRPLVLRDPEKLLEDRLLMLTAMPTPVSQTSSTSMSGR